MTLLKSPLFKGGLDTSKAGKRTAERPVTQAAPDSWKKMVNVYDAYLAPVDR